jgi:hypothetical protein
MSPSLPDGGAAGGHVRHRVMRTPLPALAGSYQVAYPSVGELRSSKKLGIICVRQRSSRELGSIRFVFRRYFRWRRGGEMGEARLQMLKERRHCRRVGAFEARQDCHRGLPAYVIVDASQIATRCSFTLVRAVSSTLSSTFRLRCTQQRSRMRLGQVSLVACSSPGAPSFVTLTRGRGPRRTNVPQYPQPATVALLVAQAQLSSTDEPTPETTMRQSHV